jgi:hypothetical protein
MTIDSKGKINNTDMSLTANYPSQMRIMKNENDNVHD